MTLLGTIVEDFSGTPTEFSSSYNTFSFTGSRGRVGCVVGTNSGLLTPSTYTLLGSQVAAQVFPAASNGATSAVTTFMAVDAATSGTRAEIVIDTQLGKLIATTQTGFVNDAGEVDLTYDPVAHAWLRLRQTSTTLLFEVSADGITYTTVKSITTPAWMTSTSNCAFEFGSFRSNGTANYAEIDNLNTTVVAPPTVPKLSQLSDDFSGGLNSSTWAWTGAVVSGNACHIPASNTTTGVYDQLRSVVVYDGTSSSAFEQITPALGGTSVLSEFRLENATGTDFSCQFTAGTATFGLRTAFAWVGTPQTFTYAAPLFIKVSEASGAITFSRSVTGLTGTFVAIGSTLTTPSWWNSIRMVNQATNTGGISNDMVIDYINIVPTASGANAKTATLTDTFDGNAVDTTKWTVAGGAAVVNDQAILPDISATATFTSVNAYDLTDSSTSIKCVPSLNVNDESHLIVRSATTGSELRMSFGVGPTGQVLTAWSMVGGTETSPVRVTYDPVRHLYWKIVHSTSANAVTWSTSADSVSWALMRTIVPPAWDMTAVHIVLQADNTATGIV